jgi:hypothetical protein
MRYKELPVDRTSTRRGQSEKRGWYRSLHHFLPASAAAVADLQAMILSFSHEITSPLLGRGKLSTTATLRRRETMRAKGGSQDEPVTRSVGLDLHGWVLDDKSPDVVTQSIRSEASLFDQHDQSCVSIAVYTCLMGRRGRLTLMTVLFLTCFVIVSAKLLSNLGASGGCVQR